MNEQDYFLHCATVYLLDGVRRMPRYMRFDGGRIQLYQGSRNRDDYSLGGEIRILAVCSYRLSRDGRKTDITCREIAKNLCEEAKTNYRRPISLNYLSNAVLEATNDIRMNFSTPHSIDLSTWDPAFCEFQDPEYDNDLYTVEVVPNF